MSIETIQFPKKVWLAAVDAATKLINSPNLPATHREFYEAVFKAAAAMEKEAWGGESGERDCSDPVFEAALRLCLSANELQAKRIVALTAENDKLRLENKELWNRPRQTIPLSSTEPPKPLVTEQELGIRGPLKLGSWTNEFPDDLFDQDDKAVFVTSSSTYSDVRIRRAIELLRIWNAAHHPTVEVVDTKPPVPATEEGPYRAWQCGGSWYVDRRDGVTADAVFCKASAEAEAKEWAATMNRRAKEAKP